MIKKSRKENSWRLVHNGKEVLELFESEGYTETKFELFEADSKKKCLEEIERLKLVFLEKED